MSWYDGKGRAAREGRGSPKRKRRQGIYSGVQASGSVRVSGSRPAPSRRSPARSFEGVRTSGRVSTRDPALRSNAVTGLSPEKEAVATKAFEADSGPKHLAEVVSNIALTALPGSVAVRGASIVPRLIKAAKVADEAGDGVKAAKLMRAARESAKASKNPPRSARAAKVRSANDRTRFRRKSSKKRHPEDMGWGHEIATRYGLVPTGKLPDGAKLYDRVVHPEIRLRRKWRGATLTPAYSAIASSKGAEIADWYWDTGSTLYRVLADREYAERLRKLQESRSPGENRAAMLRAIKRYGED